ncbi:hypothetical protein ACH5AO_27510 [Streptomyces sp. NPDC018964]|uniref:hypothetical protein n=1 Tax=Streptomyces sp. NPDC018964 TaxID=3365058 RepID=UPI0037A1A7E2
MVFVVAPLGVPGNVRLAADARGEHPVATGTFTGSGAYGSGFAWSRTFFAVWCEVALGSV